MRAVDKHYWLRAIAVSVIAFALGVAMFILVGIALAHGMTAANAAHQQISVAANDVCNCIVKFAPNPPLAGSGTEEDPFMAYNANVSLLMGLSGAGVITIEDQNGNVLLTHTKSTTAYEEVTRTVTLPAGVGLYELTIFFDGIIMHGPSVVLPMFINYEELPIGPPDTGLGMGHLYVGGYAVQTFGVLWAGFLCGAVAFGIFVLIAIKRRKQEEARTQNNYVFGKAMRRQLSSKDIDRSGVIVKKSRAKRGKKKSR